MSPPPSGLGAGDPGGVWTSSLGDVPMTTCGRLGEIMGGYERFGQGAWLEGQYTLGSHEYVDVALTFVKIDSWDGERATVSVDGSEIWSASYGVTDAGENICGAGGDWNEAATAVGPVPIPTLAAACAGVWPAAARCA